MPTVSTGQAPDFLPQDGVHKGRSKIKDDKLLRYVNNSIDNYPYEEERRLFYVALTRTKNEVFMLVDKKNPSIFIKELINDNTKYIE